MKRSSLLALTAVLAAAFAGACGNEMPFDPMDPRLDGARLVIVGSPAVTLMYGGEANLRVRYEAADGSAIENAPLDYAIVGEPGGSRLAALQTVTDVAGEAAMNLSAGNTNATFDVRVTPPAGDPVNFSVAVSDTESGSIVVSMTYAGSRDLVRFDTFLYRGERCADMNPSSLPTAIRSAPSVSTVAAMPAFAGVPVASDYAVAVVARNGSAVAAFGCRDGIVVTNGNETPVNITLMDVEIPPSFVGVWDLDNRFDFGGALPETVELVLDILSEIADDSAIDGDFGPGGDSDGDGVWPEYGQDPGAFVVDLAMRQTCAWECAAGEDYDTCSEMNHELGDLRSLYVETWFTPPGEPEVQSRFTGGCTAWPFIHKQVQDLVNDQLDALLPDFITDWLNLVSDLSRAITDANILSVLTINQATAGNEFDLPMQHELVQMRVPYRNPLSDPPGMMETRTFALADAGITGLMVDDITSVDGTTLNIPEHSFTLNWGDLVLYIYRNVLLDEIWGVTSTGDLFAMWVDCNQVATWLEMEIRTRFGSSPSVSTLEGYCGTALTVAGSVLEAQLAELLDVDGTITIQGSAMGTDIDESTGRVDTLSNGMWSGCFNDDSTTSCSAATANDITGTFTGMRRGSGG